MPKTEEQCKQLRDEMRNRILKQSMLYFARNGFAGTKISDLAKSIGIGQGTIYIYFKSKEELFKEIFKLIQYSEELRELKLLQALPISAKQKLHLLSEAVISKLKQGEIPAAKVTLNTQIYFEAKNFASKDTTYQTELYKYTESIITQGQKEGTFAEGSAKKLADYYWGVIYLYSLKQLFTTEFEMISTEDLERTVLHG